MIDGKSMFSLKWRKPHSQAQSHYLFCHHVHKQMCSGPQAIIRVSKYVQDIEGYTMHTGAVEKALHHNTNHVQ